MTRRNFISNTLAALAAISALGMSKCAEGGANAMLSSLRNVLKAVDKALQSLTLLGGLLPDIVHTVAVYLTAVTQFVDDAATILEDEVKSAAQKASEILAMVGKVILPAINNSQVSQILVLVDAALNLFLAFFGGSTKQPRGVAPANVPSEIRLSNADRRYLETIEGLAVAERTAVAQWEAHATGKIAQTTPSRNDFIVSGETNVVNNEGNVSVTTTGTKSPAIVGKDNVVKYK